MNDTTTMTEAVLRAAQAHSRRAELVKTVAYEFAADAIRNGATTPWGDGIIAAWGEVERYLPGLTREEMGDFEREFLARLEET